MTSQQKELDAMYWDNKVSEIIEDHESDDECEGPPKFTNPGERCTIVTCYYRSPAKHSFESYDEWMTNFLTTIDNEMIIFCDEESYDKIVELRKKFEEKTMVFVHPLQDTYCGHEVYMEYWKKDIQRDVEKHIHNTNLYIIWNEKSMFVQKVMSINPFNTDFFMWCDIGCFRNKDEMPLFAKEWPSKDFLRTAQKDKMYFLHITPFEPTDFEILPNGLTKSFEYVTRIGATMFLGHKSIFSHWVEMYYKYMNDYTTSGYFAGKDQNIIATMYVLHPELFRLVRPVEGEGNPWFYLQRYFLQAEK
jgi:hypothetical protein